jgi:hypothetical protein
MKKVVDTLNALLKKHDIKGVTLSEIPTEVKMSKEDVLTDGTKIATPSDSFAVGSELYTIDADGNPQVAPDGEHTMADGTILVVSGGVISEVKEAPAEEEEMSADVAAVIEAMDAELTKVKSDFATSQTELSAMKTELASAKSDLLKSQAKVTELSKKAAVSSVKKEVVFEKQETPVLLKKKQSTRDIALSIITKSKNN